MFKLKVNSNYIWNKGNCEKDYKREVDIMKNSSLNKKNLTLNDKDVIDLIIEAYNEAYCKVDNEVYNLPKDIGKRNKNRSRRLIKLITNKLIDKTKSINSPENIKVFSLTNKSNRSWNLCELLFDIHVCRMSNIKSVRNNVDIEYVIESLIQMESELNSTNSKEVIKDFSK